MNCMSSLVPQRTLQMRPPIEILGVPFDNVSKAEALELIKQMVVSHRPTTLLPPISIS
jgi:hypothetical protein